MRKRLIFLFTAASCFLFFLFFSYLVHKDKLTSIDFDTTVRLQDNISPGFDSLFSFFSDTGSFEISTLFLGMIIIILIFLKNYLAAAGAVVMYAVFHLVEIFGKLYVDHPPPPQFLLKTRHIVEFPRFHVRSDFSYPSGHAGRTVFLAVIVIGVIWQSRMKRLLKLVFTAIFAIYVGLMLVSRVYLGEHWLSDVLGGILLSVSLSFTVLLFTRKIPVRR